MLTQSQSLYDLLSTEWIHFLLHPFYHYLLSKQPSQPSKAIFYIPNVCKASWVILNPFFPFVPLWREKLETVNSFLYLIVCIFSISVENLPSHQIKCNIVYKDNSKSAYSHLVISSLVFLPPFNL